MDGTPAQKTSAFLIPEGTETANQDSSACLQNTSAGVTTRGKRKETHDHMHVTDVALQVSDTGTEPIGKAV